MRNSFEKAAYSSANGTEYVRGGILPSEFTARFSQFGDAAATAAAANIAIFIILFSFDFYINEFNRAPYRRADAYVRI